MAKKPDIHVVPRDNGWAVKKERSERASSVHETKREAIEQARAQAKRDKVELVIHNKDNKISDPDSFGRDPNPPKDRKH